MRRCVSHLLRCGKDPRAGPRTRVGEPSIPVIHPQVFHCGTSVPRNPVKPAVPAAQASIRFGASSSMLKTEGEICLHLALPLLAGDGVRTLPLGDPGQSRREPGGFTLWEDMHGHLWGVGTWPTAGQNLTGVTRDAYCRLFALSRHHSLHRLWNFVPGINAELDGLEHYRRFCIGRSEAFTEAFGSAAEAHMPAGSAVGIDGSELVVVFLAGAAPARHFENPIQVPAYEYPLVHSPRPPSFARASIASDADGRQQVFISGTAAVRGHTSASPDDLRGQLDTTLEVLGALGETMGLGSKLAPPRTLGRQFLVYVRHPHDLAVIRARLEADLFKPDDLVTYVRADICRRELLFEIEGSMSLDPA